EVMGRWRQFRGAERGFRATVLGHQTHGVQVARTDAGEGWIQLEGVDGHVTTARGILLTVTVADCIPVYLVDVNGRASRCSMRGGEGRPGGYSSAVSNSFAAVPAASLQVSQCIVA
ncbi:MAG: laccase domain-containing protein, partial [Gemmatimonadota bacterium]|nr:laccase domain-containing protein [Gemmatimonadota bacterium]